MLVTSILCTVGGALWRRDSAGQRTRSFIDEAMRAGALHRRLPRIETVDTSQIVGSVGRAHELKSDFRPPRHQRL